MNTDKNSINLKNDIFIKGYETMNEYLNDVVFHAESGNIMWVGGSPSDITEEEAKGFVQRMSIFTPQFRAYDKTYSDYYETAKESFLSACKGFKYCLVYQSKH